MGWVARGKYSTAVMKSGGFKYIQVLVTIWLDDKIEKLVKFSDKSVYVSRAI